MITKIQKWGNSLGVRIPRSVAQAGELTAGMQVEVRNSKKGLALIPVRKKQYRLDDLLKKVSKKNLHKVVDDGGPVGREPW